MLKNLVQFKSVVKDRESTWHLDNDCPLEVAKEMLFQFQKALGQIEDQVKAQLEAQKASEAAKVEPIEQEQAQG